MDSFFDAVLNSSERNVHHHLEVTCSACWHFSTRVKDNMVQGTQVALLKI